MKKWTFTLHNWLPDKNNGNPKFWAISFLPEIQMQYSSNSIFTIHIGWLFWTFSIEKWEDN